MGRPGIGNANTALEAAFFMEKRNMFTDGILFLDLQEKEFESPLIVAKYILKQLTETVEYMNFDDILEELDVHLDDKNTLFIFSNLDHI
jgi:hypothetical protein